MATKNRDRKEVQQLIEMGKSKGFLTYEEVNDALPADMAAPDQMEDVLLLGWKDEQQRIRAASSAGGLDAPSRLQVTFSADDLRTLQQEVSRADLSPVYGTYLEILRAIRGTGIKFSDRRAVKAQKVFAASALLDGRREVDLPDLRYLANLWTDEADEESLRRIVAEHGVPVDEEGNRVRELHDIIDVDLATIRARLRQVGTEQELRKLGREAQRLASELRRDHPTADEGSKTALNEVQAVQKDILIVLRERFPWRGTDYV